MSWPTFLRGEGAAAAPTVREVLVDLRAAGLLAANSARQPGTAPDRGAPPSVEMTDEVLATNALARDEESGQPWFTRVLIGAGTWVGAVLIAIFLGLTDLLGNPAAHTVFGTLSFVGAAFAARRSRGDLATQLALVGVVAGQTLLVLAIDSHRASTNLAVLMGLQVVTVLAVPDGLVRRLATVAFVIVAASLVTELEVPGGRSAVEILVAAGLFAAFHHDARLGTARLAALCRPIAYGLAVGLMALVLGVERGIGSSYSGDVEPGAGAVATMGIAIILGYLVWRARSEVGRRDAMSRSGVPGANSAVWEPAIVVALIAIALVALITASKPAVLAALLLIALAHHRGERLLAGLGLVGLAIALAIFYYELDTTLLWKSLIVLATGAVLLVARAAVLQSARGAATRDTDGEVPASGARGDLRPVLANALATALAIGGPLLLALQKEHLLRTGTTVLLALRPVDPRSLIQGDYMILGYAIADEAAALPGLGRDGRLVLAVDVTGVARLVGLDMGVGLAPGEQRLRYRVRGSHDQWGEPDVRLGAESYLFEEGRAQELSIARFAELRVSPSGESVLVGLRDAALEPLGAPR